MINSFAISPVSRGIKLQMGGTGIVAMATGVDTVWVNDNFVSLGGDQTITGVKMFASPTPTVFFSPVTVSGSKFKLLAPAEYEGVDGPSIMDFNPTFDDGGPNFQILSFAPPYSPLIDFWHRKAYDNWGAVSVDWDNLILSGHYNNVPWQVPVGLLISGRCTISGKSPAVSEWNNLNLGNRTLHDNLNGPTIDWQNGLLYNWVGTKAMNFKSGALYNTSARKVFDWHFHSLSGNWTATELTITTGRMSLTTGNYGFTQSGVVLAAGFRSAVSLLTGIYGTRYEIGSGNLINRGVILVSGNGILSRLPDITIATYTGGGASYTFKMVTTGTGFISGFTTDQPIDGQPQIGLSGLNKFVTLQPYGANWYIIGQN